MCERLPQCVTLGAIYALYFLTFLLAGGAKLKEGTVPDWFKAQFAKSFIARFPGMSISYWTIAILECLVPLLIVMSLAHGEYSVGSTAFYLRLAVSLASVLFAILGFGQRLVSDFLGAANSFFYFAGTLVTQLAISTLI